MLSIAAQAPIRGYLLVGEQEAGAAEVSVEAAVTKAQAETALVKLKRIGVLERDNEVGAWFVHDWADMNPEPKHDATNAKRQADYRARRTACNGGVTP